MEHDAKEKIWKEMITVGHWLSGNLETLGESKDDIELLSVLNRWLAVNVQKQDPLMVGEVTCQDCSTKWEVLAYEETLSKLECPSCGKQNSIENNSEHNQQFGNPLLKHRNSSHHRF